MAGLGAVQQWEREKTNAREVQLQHPEQDMPNAQQHTCKRHRWPATPATVNQSASMLTALATQQRSSLDELICNMNRCGGMLQ